MQIAKLFFNGGSQAVRLPKAFRFEGIKEVVIQRDGDRIILMAKQPQTEGAVKSEVILVETPSSVFWR